MKKLSAFVFAVAICALGNAQGVDTHVKDGRILYQHVFDGAIENPLEFIENLKGVGNVRELNGAYFGDVRVLQTDVKSIMTQVGLRWANTMIFLQSADSKSQVQIEVKEDRYRVTVSDILLDFTNPSMGSDKPLELYNLSNDPGETTNLANSAKAKFNEMSAALRVQVQRGGAVPWQPASRRDAR